MYLYLFRQFKKKKLPITKLFTKILPARIMHERCYLDKYDK